VAAAHTSIHVGGTRPCGQNLLRLMKTPPGGTEAAAGAHSPVALSRATNPWEFSPSSEVKVTVIVEALTLSRAGRSVPLNSPNKLSVPLPR
jgi:hypothetical protein